MCLQDLRFADRTTYRQVTIPLTGNVSTNPLPDLSRCLLLWVRSGDGGASLSRAKTIAPAGFVPADTRYVIPLGPNTLSGSCPVYTRESLGPLLRAPLWVVDADGGGTAILHMFEVDDETYSLIKGR